MLLNYAAKLLLNFDICKQLRIFMDMPYSATGILIEEGFFLERAMCCFARNSC